MRIGIIGAGRLGLAIARLATTAGHEVRAASSSDREELELVLEYLAPGVTAATVAEAVRDADVTVVAIPLHRYRELPAGAFAGKVVIDAMNYWPENNGTMAEFEAGRSSSEVVAAAFPGARLVKSLNQIGYGDLESASRPAGAPDRRLMAVASDDAEARALVATFVESLGFDAVELPTLAAGRVLEPRQAWFGRPLERADLAVTAQPALSADRRL